MNKSLSRKCKLLIVLLTMLTPQLSAQYSISSIDQELKENSNAVFHKNELTFEIIDKYQTRVTRHKVITVFNQNARQYGVEAVHYSTGSKLKEFRARLLDANGKEIRKLKKSEFIDRSSISGFSLYEDDRVRIADFKQRTYPFTVEFYYEVEYNNTFYSPDWYVLPDENIAVKTSSFSMIAPDSLLPNYKLINTKVEPLESFKEGKKRLSWKFKSLKSFEFEPYNYELKYYSPIIYTASQKFGYDGYEGDMSSWKSFGEWIVALNKNRGQLSQSTIHDIKDITKDLRTREEKVKAVYTYLQSKTRYVSIQLGIGGYQPFEASTVDQYGYGDCKALTNYTQSLLETINIDSYYTLIKAGKRSPDIDAEFATSTFNHVILSVPNEGDTIWLECTSQSNPFGYLGTFTDNRNALLIKPGGSEIVRTTNYLLRDNVQRRFANVTINKNGNAHASIHTKYKGIQYENNGVDRIAKYSAEDQKKWLYKNLDLGSFSLESYDINEIKGRLPQVDLLIKGQINDLAAISGKRIFFKPNLMNRLSYLPKKLEDRNTPIIVKRSYRDVDSIHYSLPDSYYVEYIPEPIEITSKFGYYRMQLIKNKESFIYVREREIYAGKYEKEEYENFIEFHRSIFRADNEKVVLVNKT